jgi:hypothetical protein
MGGGGNALQSLRRALFSSSRDRILQGFYALYLFVAREARAFLLLNLRELRLERLHARFFERLLTQSLALRLVLGYLLLPLLPAMRIAGGQRLRGAR